jgi:Flp pilus assembly protein TadG
MSKLLRRRGRYYFERGATLVEATFLIPILLLLAIGLSEVGLTVIDWMAVSNASREGARVGAAAGSNATSDDLILQVVGQASCAIDNGELTSVRIYKSDLNGDMVSNAENVYTLNSLNCATKTAIAGSSSRSACRRTTTVRPPETTAGGRSTTTTPAV